MVNRQNKTTRPDVPVQDPAWSLEEAHTRIVGNKAADLRLWAEVADNVDSNGDGIWLVTPGAQTNGTPKTDLILLFLKQFDVEKQSLSGAGYIYISKEKKVEDLVPAILKKMGYAEKTASGEKVQLKLFEACSYFKPARRLDANYELGNQANHDRAHEGEANTEGCGVARWRYCVLSICFFGHQVGKRSVSLGPHETTHEC